MGREIRRVPKDWQHPTYGDLGQYCRRGPNEFHPVHDQDYVIACKEWIAGMMAWENGTDPHQISEPQYKPSGANYVPYWDWHGGPPDENTHRHGKWVFSPEDATHYQFYEDTSEGTPLSPVFETLPELVDWMVKSGGYSREGAEAFAKQGWAISFAILPGHGIVNGVEAAGILDKA